MHRAEVKLVKFFMQQRVKMVRKYLYSIKTLKNILNFIIFLVPKGPPRYVTVEPVNTETFKVTWKVKS